MSRADLSNRPRVLLTGATGYVGGRLLRALEGAGHPVRCLTRRPDALAGRLASTTTVERGDVLDRDSLLAALDGIHVAFYLVHAMSSSESFEEADRAGAVNFAAAAREAGVGRIVYLGGLGNDRRLSAHLRSRQEVGRILRESGAATIELRASIVIGSGSASFEIVRALVDRLPVMPIPRWVETQAQPIGIEDVIGYLLGSMDLPMDGSRIIEIGGPEPVSYADIMREYAHQTGLRRRLVRFPLLNTRASGICVGLITPVYADIGRAMANSLRHETVVSDASAAAFGICPRGMREAIERALKNEDHEFAQTRWSDALPARKPRNWGGVAFGRRSVVSRRLSVAGTPAEAFGPIQRVGGEAGWYYANAFWRLRGRVDAVVGGVGLRRGRRHPVLTAPGETLDFWRVEAFEVERLLRLAAEMKIPGRLWLQFEVQPSIGGATICQTVIFDPAGVVGLAYWYGLYAVHTVIFAGMLRAIGKRIDAIRQTATVGGEPSPPSPWPGVAMTTGAPGPAPGRARKQQTLELFEGLPQHYDAAGAALSFGQDPRWRRRMVARVRAGAQDRVLDVATGTGIVAEALVRRYGCKVVGLDQSPAMLAQATERLSASPGLAAHVELVRGEAESLPFADGEFDHLTFTYLLRYVEDPAATLRELARVVKPGGRVASLEFNVPSKAVARSLWHGYTRLGLPVLGRLISRDWYEVGRFLEPSISDLDRRLPPARQLELWRAAGIASVQAEEMSFGGGVVIWGTRGA